MNRRRSAVIVDDNAAARVLLKHYLTEGHPDITIVGEAGSLAQGIRQVRETRPDVLFLDVELKKVKGKVVESGFDLLKEIEPLRPTVIFTTGFEGYAVRAIRFSAFDYLVKPFDADQLAEVLARLDKEVDDAARPDHPSLHANLQPHDGISLPVVLKGGGVSLELVKKARIIHAQPVARGQNTLVELEGREEVVVTRTLGQLESLLTPEDHFLRIHDSHLVNFNYVQRYVRGEPGYVVVTVRKEGKPIPVSRTMKPDVVAMLDRWFPLPPSSR